METTAVETPSMKTKDSEKRAEVDTKVLPRSYPPMYHSGRRNRKAGLPPYRRVNGRFQPPNFDVLRWDLHAESRVATARPANRRQVPNPLVRSDSLDDLPNPLAWSSNLVRAIFDVLGGRRELAGLRRWIEPQLYRRLAARTSTLKPARKTAPVRVRSARLCKLTPQVAEAAVIVEDQGRIRAAAIRLEAFRGRWRVTALELG